MCEFKFARKFQRFSKELNIQRNDGISGGCLIFQLIIFIRKSERIGQRLSGSPSSDGGTIKEMSEMATNRDMKMSFII